MTYTEHTLCTAFPDMTPEEFDELCLSIETSGQRDPIVVMGGEILDGKNRMRACRKLSIQPKIRQYDPAKDGASISQFVADRNLTRRSLTASQRAAIGADMESTIKAEREAQGLHGRSRAAAADAVGVSETSIHKAGKLKKESPAMFDKVKAGEVSLDEALKNADPTDEQRTQAADIIAVEFGDEFSERVRASALLPGKNLREFTALTRREQGDVIPLVEHGWSPRLAAKFVRGEFAETDTIKDMLAFADWKGGAAELSMPEHSITITAL